MLTLYYTLAPVRWPCASPLEEAAAPHQLVRVDFAAGQQRTPEYLAINPRGGCPRWSRPRAR